MLMLTIKSSRAIELGLRDGRAQFCPILWRLQMCRCVYVDVSNLLSVRAYSSGFRSCAYEHAIGTSSPVMSAQT